MDTSISRSICSDTLRAGVIGLVSRAPDRIGFSAENTKEGNHWFSTRRIAPQPEMRLKLLQYQAFGDLLGLPATPIEFGLAASEAERERARDILKDAPRPLLGVILGSSWPSRIYFPKYIAAVIRGVAERKTSMATVPRFFRCCLAVPRRSVSPPR